MYVTNVVEEEKKQEQSVGGEKEEKGDRLSQSRVSMKRAEIPIIAKEPVIDNGKVETIPIQTGSSRSQQPQQPQQQSQVENPMDKMIKLQSEETTENTMMRLRKLSQDFAEKERKKSMEIANVPITPNPGEDDFVFSDDGSFDVPDL